MSDTTDSNPFSLRDTTLRADDRHSEATSVLPIDRSPKKLRVLLVYTNYMMVNLLPTNMGILTACLEQNGFQVELFDTTLYRTAEQSPDEARVELLQLRKFDLQKYGIRYKETDYLEDFKSKVAEFDPDLIGYTTVEDTWPQCVSLIEAVSGSRARMIVGGVFPTLAPDLVISQPRVDMVCVGEGERALTELCYRLERGESYLDVPNLWVRNGAEVHKNPIGNPIHLDDVPHSSWDLFEKERFYRPMQGRVFRMVPIETDRGCPYTCRFCEAPSLVSLYRQETGYQYFRRKSWSRVREEIEVYVERYGAEYIYFNAETFLAMSAAEFEVFIEMYRDFSIPFWMQTRIETLTEERVKALESVNCNRISIGLEHGNEEFRNNIVGKGFSNADIVRVFEILGRYSIPVTVNNILGFPGETRELIFDTIDLNRQLKSDSVNAFYFAPYHGTPMRQECEEKGYIERQTTARGVTVAAVMDMPQLSKDALLGLVRTFSLYSKFPRDEWPTIEVAERFDEAGNEAFRDLSKQYYERFFDDDFKRTRKACVSSAIYRSPKKITEDIIPG